MQSLVQKSLEALSAEQGHEVQLCNMPAFEDFFPERDDGFELLPPMTRPELSTPAVILHSSGEFRVPSWKILFKSAPPQDRRRSRNRLSLLTVI